MLNKNSASLDDQSINIACFDQLYFTEDSFSSPPSGDYTLILKIVCRMSQNASVRLHYSFPQFFAATVHIIGINLSSLDEYAQRSSLNLLKGLV